MTCFLQDWNSLLGLFCGAELCALLSRCARQRPLMHGMDGTPFSAQQQMPPDYEAKVRASMAEANWPMDRPGRSTPSSSGRQTRTAINMAPVAAWSEIASEKGRWQDG